MSKINRIRSGLIFLSAKSHIKKKMCHHAINGVVCDRHSSFGCQENLWFSGTENCSKAIFLCSQAPRLERYGLNVRDIIKVDIAMPLQNIDRFRALHKKKREPQSNIFNKSTMTHLYASIASLGLTSKRKIQ